MEGTGATRVMNGTAGSDQLPNSRRFCRSLVQSRILVVRSSASPGGAPEQQDFLQVPPIHDRPDDQQRAPNQHADGPPAPSVPSDQRPRHAERAERDQRLPGFVGHRSGSTTALAQRRYAAGLPGIQRDRKAYQRHHNAQDYRKLLELHDCLECKKGARPNPFGRAGRQGAVNFEG